MEEQTSELEELGNKLETVLTENKSQKKELDDLHVALNDSNSKNEEQEKEITELKSKLDTVTSEKSNLTSENESLQRTIEFLEKRVSELKAKRKSIKSQLDAKTFECAFLSIELQEQKRKNTELLKKMDSINGSKSEFKSLLDKSIPMSEFSEYCIGNESSHEYEYVDKNNRTKIIHPYHKIMSISPDHVLSFDTKTNIHEIFNSKLEDLKINLLHDIRCGPQHAEVAVGLVITVLRNNPVTDMPFLCNIFDDMYKKFKILYVSSKDDPNRYLFYKWMYCLLSHTYSEFIGCKAVSSSKYNEKYPVNGSTSITLQSVINMLFPRSNEIILPAGTDLLFDINRTIHRFCRSVGEYEIQGCIDGVLNSKGGNDEDHLSDKLLNDVPIADADASRKWSYYPTKPNHNEYYTTIPFASKNTKWSNIDYNLLDALTAFGKFNAYRGDSEACIIQCFYALRNKSTIRNFLITLKSQSRYDRIFDSYTCTVRNDKYYNTKFEYGFAEYMMVYAFDFLNEHDINAQDIMSVIYPNSTTYKVNVSNRMVYNGTQHKDEAHTIKKPGEIVVRLLASYITFMIFSHDNFGVPLFSHRAVNPESVELYLRGDVNASSEQKWNKNISITHRIFTTEVIPFVKHVYNCLMLFTKHIPNYKDNITISCIAEGFWKYCEERGLEELRSKKVNKQKMDSDEEEDSEEEEEEEEDSEEEEPLTFSLTAKCKKSITPGDIYYRLILGRHASYDINTLIKIDTEKRTVSIKHGSRIGNLTPYGPESDSKKEFMKLAALAPYNRIYQRSLYNNFKKTFDMLHELYHIRIEMHKQSVS